MSQRNSYQTSQVEEKSRICKRKNGSISQDSQCPHSKCPLPEEAYQGKNTMFTLKDNAMLATDEDIMQSMRLQEIIMMQMKNDYMFTHTFRASIKPKKSTREAWEERQKSTGDPDILENMLSQLETEFNQTKDDFIELKMLEEEKKNKKTCTCGVGRI